MPDKKDLYRSLDADEIEALGPMPADEGVSPTTDRDGRTPGLTAEVRASGSPSRHYPNYPDGDNSKQGWWEIPPGGTATVRGGASNGARYFCYAETDTGLQWAGELFTWLPTTAFDWCWPTSSSNASLRGMQRLDVPWSSVNHTLVLR